MTYCFDGFTLDSRTRRLLDGDVERHLSPKAFDLLLLLVENRSRAMSKVDLQKRLWPDTFVLDTNIAGLIVEIRRALGDTADQPRYVRTVPRFGYWFVGDVHEIEERPKGGRPPVRHWLIWETRQIALPEGDSIIGRAADADVWIDAAGVSRHHARVRLDDTQATVEDLGSKNGTYVGGRRVTGPTSLHDGDHIRLGTVVVTFRIPPPAGSTQSVGS